MLMSRSYDWSPLDLGIDPIPGSPAVLRAQATKFRNVAENIAEAARQLRAIANTCEATGEFVEEFAVQANEVADRIGKARKRYDGFADALYNYAAPLERVQSNSVAALTRAINGRKSASSAQYWVTHYKSELREPNLEATEIARLQKLLDGAEQDKAEADSEVYYAKLDLEGVVIERDREATAAANAINQVGEDSGINDTGWDNWVQFWEENGDLIDNIVSVIGIIAAIFVVVALFVPGLNLIVGGVIGLVMLVSVIAAGLAVVNAICQASAGTKSINEAVIEIGLAVIPFGLGRFVPKAGAAQLLDDAVNAGIRSTVASAAGQGVEGVTRTLAAEAIEAVLGRVSDPLAKLQLLAKLNLTLDGVGPTVRAILGDQVMSMALNQAAFEVAWVGLDQAMDKFELPEFWTLEHQTSW